MSVLPSRNNSRTYLSLLAAMLCVVALFAPSAAAQSLPLYAITASDSENNNLMTLDPVTGNVLSTVPITFGSASLDGGTGLALNPLTGKLFAILVLNSQSGRELVTIDPTTGIATDIGNTGDSFAGITFAPNGTLYAVTGDGGKNPSTLYTMSTTTGAVTLVKALGSNTCSQETGSAEGETIAFNSVDGLIYHMSGDGACQIFETINPTTLVSTPITITGDVPGEPVGLVHWTGNFFLFSTFNQLYIITNGGQSRAFGPTPDASYKGLVFAGTPPGCAPLQPLYGTANLTQNSPSLLYTIDPGTAAATLIGPVGFESVSGIAFNSSGTLYGAGETQDGNNTPVLITINPCTGVGTLVGPTQVGEVGFASVVDISFSKSGGTLFGFLLSTEESNALSTFNLANGAVGNPLATYDSAPGGGIAFSSANVLFNAFGSSLETLNTTTGAMTSVGELIFPGLISENNPAVNAMDFQPSTGTLFGSVSALNVESGTSKSVRKPNEVPLNIITNYLVTINTDGGPVTLVGSGATQTGLAGIAFSPAVVLAPASITATGGTPQSASIEEAFALPLQATVKDSNSNPVAGVTVTFTPPATGASAFLQGGTNTAVTNASGVATSVSVFANSTVGGPYNVAATVVGVATPANFALTNTVGQPEQIIIKAGTPQTATVTTAFALPLSVTVEDEGGNPVPGVTITFTPPSTGASGTFAGGNTAVTNSSGVATSGTFTANGTSGGPYNVTASLPEVGSPEFRAATVHPEGFATQVTFSLKNVDFSVTPTTTTQTVAPGATANYSLNFTAIVGNSTSATTFSCTGLPSLSACTFNPTSLPANSPTTPFTLAISTTAPGTTTNVGPANRFVGPLTKLVRPGVLTLMAMLALMLAVFAIPKRRFARLRVSAVGVFGFAALLLLTSYISGCGSTGTGFPLGNNNPGTPAGTYTVTIVGTSGAVQRSTTVTLVVQ